MLKSHGCICITNLVAVLHLMVCGLSRTYVLHKDTWWMQPWLVLVLTHVHFVEALVQNRLVYMTCKALLVLQLYWYALFTWRLGVETLYGYLACASLHHFLRLLNLLM